MILLAVWVLFLLVTAIYILKNAGYQGMLIVFAIFLLTAFVTTTFSLVVLGHSYKSSSITTHSYNSVEVYKVGNQDIIYTVKSGGLNNYLSEKIKNPTVLEFDTKQYRVINYEPIVFDLWAFKFGAPREYILCVTPEDYNRLHESIFTGGTK